MRCWMINCDTGLDRRFFTLNYKGTVINFQLGLIGPYGFIFFLSWNPKRLFSSLMYQVLCLKPTLMAV